MIVFLPVSNWEQHVFSREIGDSDLGGNRNVSMVISTPASASFSSEFPPIFQHARGEGYQHLINLAISLLYSQNFNGKRKSVLISGLWH